MVAPCRCCGVPTQYRNGHGQPLCLACQANLDAAKVRSGSGVQRMSERAERVENVLEVVAAVSWWAGCAGLILFFTCLVCGVLGAEWAQGPGPPRIALVALSGFGISFVISVCAMSVLTWRMK